ncbi:MAG TPA: D-alanyl-D-alanine carboxypeptidase family protein [Solirubrobacterales bacterium]|nr:D-alanyl-D-alanine carboxypeptidase family protein [Solirubrobacterales bacterium]
MRPGRAGAMLLAMLVLAVGLVSSAPAGAAPGPAEIEAKEWIVVDARGGDVLASRGAERRVSIASATKLMTAYVAMKELELDQVVRAAPYEALYGESLMGLRTGERVSVRDLLFGLILISGNDAAHTLAIAAAGSEDRFVAQMNRYAAALGLADTHYANPIGLDEPGNFSTAADLATLTRRLLRIPAFAEIADAPTALLRSLRPRRRIETLNDLLYMVPWATGVKTGHTFDAGYVLIASGERDGVELVSVSLGGPTEESRFADSLKLLEYGLSQYRRRLPIRAGRTLAEPEIRYSGGALPLRAEQSLQVGLRQGQRLDLRIAAPDEVEGPVRRGARLGRAAVFVDGRRVGSVPLLAGRDVPEASAFDLARTFLADNSIPIAVAAFVILMVAGTLLRRLARRNELRSRIG